MSQIISAVESLADKLKIRLDKVYIENKVFRLHSTVTVAIFFLCCGLVTMQQLIGKHIQCILPPNEDIRQDALNQYCFIMSTYTLPHLYNQNKTSFPYEGVGTHDPENAEHKQKYHAYYQWVPFALFFQGLMFLLPHHVWKSFEGGRIKAYCDLELADKIPMKSRSLLSYKNINPDKMINRAAVYFKDNLTYNNMYASWYVICEILNFTFVVANIFITDAFLGNEFLKYGHQVFSFVAEDPENRIDPMNKVFPKVTKCDFRKFGPSGNIVRYDIMCVLALNIINEKIYVFLWFWFIILAIQGGINIIYRIFVIMMPRIRNGVIKRKILEEYNDDVDVVLDELNYGDWFILKRIADNINRIRFGELFHEIRKAISVKERLSESNMYTTPPTTSDKRFDSNKVRDPDSSTEVYVENANSNAE